jgi:Protein of unknown function (DUF3309)
VERKHPLRHLQARCCFRPSGNIHGQKKLCSENPTHDCRGGKIKCRSDTKNRHQGSDCRSDCCGRSRRRSGFAVNARRSQGGEANDSGEKAGAQVKATSCAQGVEKEKTLNRRPSPPPSSDTVAAYPATGFRKLTWGGASLWNGMRPAELTVPVAGDWDRSKLENAMSVGTIILIILVIALLGGFSGIGGGPFYGTGYYGGGGLGLVIVVLLILLLLGKL